MTNKYLEKIAKAAPFERVEPTMKATVGDTVNRAVSKVARSGKGKAGIVAGAVAGGAALGALATKAMSKQAGIPDLFPEKIGKGIERFAEGPANKAARHLINNKRTYAIAGGSAALGALAHKVYADHKQKKQ